MIKRFGFAGSILLSGYIGILAFSAAFYFVRNFDGDFAKPFLLQREKRNLGFEPAKALRYVIFCPVVTRRADIFWNDINLAVF